MNNANDLAEALIAYLEQGIKDEIFRQTHFPHEEYRFFCNYYLSTNEPIDLTLGVKIIELLAFIRDQCNE